MGGLLLVGDHSQTRSTPSIAPSSFSSSTLPALAVGDWVFRNGTAAESYIIQNLSQGEFSHVGVVISLTPEPLIIHATTDDNPAYLNQVIVTSLADFISPTFSKHFAIARLSNISAVQQQAISAWLLKQLGKPFVLAARQEPHLYCTTLILEAFEQAQVNFQPKWQQINAPLLAGEYLFPHALAELPTLNWLFHSLESPSI